MNSLVMDMINAFDYRLIPGFLALFLLLLGFWSQARRVRAKAKHCSHLQRKFK